jgi:hypothetical protein
VVTVAPVVAAAPTPPSPPTPDLAVQSFVDQIPLSGVLLGVHACIRVNGETYYIGDTINAGLKVKVAAVNPRDIIFSDESGTQYHKRY